MLGHKYTIFPQVNKDSVIPGQILPGTPVQVDDQAPIAAPLGAMAE